MRRNHCSSYTLRISNEELWFRVSCRRLRTLRHPAHTWLLIFDWWHAQACYTVGFLLFLAGILLEATVGYDEYWSLAGVLPILVLGELRKLLPQSPKARLYLAFFPVDDERDHGAAGLYAAQLFVWGVRPSSRARSASRFGCSCFFQVLRAT